MRMNLKLPRFERTKIQLLPAFCVIEHIFCSMNIGGFPEMNIWMQNCLTDQNSDHFSRANVTYYVAVRSVTVN